MHLLRLVDHAYISVPMSLVVVELNVDFERLDKALGVLDKELLLPLDERGFA